ncbi:MAG: hypothetical protein K6T63_12925 [Alicyclobacillus herbarius]|uniref:hypothetical protein n=1 Tax=Alicyclobacillus herbarius TaxID=122960 RepID=UPI002356EB8F|nr:hypothetical protein [Alicyclobacillus herbarius]MCL6633520.1 hypothetical protein [Alicyclobacillus herbarius]
MAIVNERQGPALFVAAVFLFVMLAGSFGLAHFAFPTSSQANMFFWDMERAAGFTAYELLATSVLTGLAGASGLFDKWRARKVATETHQFLSLFFLSFLMLHLWGLHEDTTIPFPWARLVVPFSSTYRPIPVGLGILAVYGLVVIIGSSLLRPHLPPKLWRGLHILSIPIFLLVTLHGILSGTDSGSHWALPLYLIPIVLFVVLSLRRLRTRTIAPSRT